MTILITGGGGFIGAGLCKLLGHSNSEDEIISVDKSNSSILFDKPKNLEVITVDLLSDNLKKKLPQSIDTIVHLAGNPNTFVTSRESRKQFLTNINLTSSILDYAEETNVSKLIFSSSCYVYTGGNKTPFLETTTVLPVDSLGASKLASEALLKAHSVSKQIDVLSLRLFTVYGPNSREVQFIPEAIKKILSTNSPAVFGNPSVKRDFIFIDDVLEAFRLAINKSLSKDFLVLNIGSGKGYSIESIVNIIRDLVNPDKEVKYATNNKKDHIIDPDLLGDITSAKKHLNWNPKMGIQEGLRIMIDKVKKNHE